MYYGMEVSKLPERISPVAIARGVASSFWRPVNSILQRVIGIPRTLVVSASYTISFLVPKCKSDPTPNLPRLLTGVEDPTSHQVVSEVRSLRKNAVNTLIRQVSKRNQLELQKWDEENAKEMEELFYMSDDDRIAMKNLALSVRSLRELKEKRSKFEDEKNSKVNKDSLSYADIKSLNENNKNLKEIEAEIAKTKKGCLDIVKSTNKWKSVFTKVLLHNDTFYDNSCELDVPFSTTSKIRAMACASQIENDKFRSTLSVTNQKLDEILNATEKISTALADFKEGIPEIPNLRNELVALRSQLEQDQVILKDVTGERDIMKVKLDALEDLIEDQEIFLNVRDKYSEVLECTKL